MKLKANYIELSSTIASVRTRESDDLVIQISDAGATLYLSMNDWKELKRYVAKQVDEENHNEEN